MARDLRNRLVLGILIGTVVVSGLALDLHEHRHQAFLILGLIGMIMGCREFVRLARPVAAGVQRAPMLIACLLLVLEAHLHTTPGRLAPGWAQGLAGPDGDGLAQLPITELILGGGLIWTILVQMARHGSEQFLPNVGATLAGLLYLGIAVNLLERLAVSGTVANPDRGTELVLLFLAATKLGDVGAYFGGRAFGRRKLAPGISPGKTWEGFYCSLAGSVIGVYGFQALLIALGAPHPFGAWWAPTVWALCLGPLGVAGDLAESCMKRAAAVKDSGTALPGFGGFLDILDALILAAPLAVLLALILP